MTTSSFGDKLRAEAAELRKQADALELAAQVMDGKSLVAKQRTVAESFTKAAKMRAAQSGANGNGNEQAAAAGGFGLGINQPSIHDAHHPDRNERRQLILDALRTAGQQSTLALQRMLAAHGVTVTPSRVLQIVHEMPEVGRVGKGTGSRWVLKGAPPPAAPTRKERFRAKAKQGDYWSKANTAARRARTAEVLAGYDLVVPKPAVPNSGLGALVANGFLKKKGDGYVRTGKEFVP